MLSSGSVATLSAAMRPPSRRALSVLSQSHRNIWHGKLGMSFRLIYTNRPSLPVEGKVLGPLMFHEVTGQGHLTKYMGNCPRVSLNTVYGGDKAL